MPREINDIDRHIGARVRMRRLKIGMSQTELGDALDISWQQLQKYEKGTNRVSAGQLQKIARALDCPVTFFYENAPGKLGNPGGGDTAAMTAFMTSPDGMALAQAFMSLPEDSKLRRNVCDVVRGIAASHAMLASKSSRARAA